MSGSNNSSVVVEREKINYSKKPEVKKMFLKRQGKEFELPVVGGMQIGMGVDVIEGQATSFALIECITAPVNLSEETQHLTVISEENEYKNEMEVIMKAQGQGLGWSFSAGVDYFSSQAGGSTSLSFVDGSTIRLKKDSMASVNDKTKWKLNSSAEKLLRKSPEKFIDQYGTHFIGGFIYGGFFLASISIITKTSDQKSNLKVSMSGAIKGFVASGSASADFRNELNSKSSKYSLKASMSSNGAFSNVDISDVASLKTSMANFNTKIIDSGGKQLVALCYPWEMLPSVQDILSDIDKTGSLNVTFNKDALVTISEEMCQLEYLYSTIKSMIENNNYIGKSQLTLLKAQKSKVQKGKENIRRLELSEIINLDVSEAEKFIVSPEIKTAIDPVVRGKCNIKFKGYLDGAFSPAGDFSGSLPATPSADWVKIYQSEHHNIDTHWDMYLQYYYFNEKNETDINGKLKVRSIMDEVKYATRVGSPVEPNKELKSHAKWDGADDNYLEAWFEE